VPGIDVRAVDVAGFSAGYYARKAGHASIAKLLPPPDYDLWPQLASEPAYTANIDAIQAMLAKKEKLRLKKLEALEKKKKK
jgi:hypothetical protein